MYRPPARVAKNVLDTLGLQATYDDFGPVIAPASGLSPDAGSARWTFPRWRISSTDPLKVRLEMIGRLPRLLVTGGAAD